MIYDFVFRLRAKCVIRAYGDRARLIIVVVISGLFRTERQAVARSHTSLSLSLRRFCCLIFSDFEILGVQHGPDYKIENVCIGVFVINDDNYLLGLL